MPDYSNGKIYKIVNAIDDEVYIGSTVQTLSQRMTKHRTDYKQGRQGKIYDHVKELGGWKDGGFQILLVEDYACDRKELLARREGEVIREMGTLNKVIAGRTIQEWKQENADKIKEWYDKNKDRLRKYSCEYFQINKDKIQQKHREYFKNNKDKLLEYARDYTKEYYNDPEKRERKRERERINKQLRLNDPDKREKLRVYERNYFKNNVETRVKRNAQSRERYHENMKNPDFVEKERERNKKRNARARELRALKKSA